MKRIILTLLVLLFASTASAATKYARNVTANWNVNSTWSTSSGGSDDTTIPTADDDVIFDANSGAITLTASTTINSIVCTGYTNTLTHNASVTLTIDGQNGSGHSLIFVSGMTYTKGNSSNSAITFTGSGTSKVTTGGKSLGTITFNNSGDTFQLQDDLTTSGDFTLTAGTFDPNSRKVTMTGNTGAASTSTISGNPTFFSLELTCPAYVGRIISLGSNMTVTGTLTVTGNSAVNRILVASNDLGTQRTITNTSVTETLSNVDFRDIAMSEAVDASSITGGSGDCGGNSGITFTTADDWFWYNSSGGTYNLSDYSHWYQETAHTNQMASTRTILPQDTCYINADSVNGTTTITSNLVQVPSLDFSGVDPVTYTIGVATSYYGSLIFSTNVTQSSHIDVYFYGRGSHTFTPPTTAFISSGANLTFYNFGGTLTLGGDFISGATNTIWFYAGTIDFNNYNFTSAAYGFLVTSTLSKTLLFRGGTISHGAAGIGSYWNIPGTGAGLTNPSTFAGTSTVIFGNTAGSNNNEFKGSGCTYNNVTFRAGTTGTLTLTGSNSFNTMTVAAGKTVKFTAGTTQTVNSFVADGTEANPIVLDNTTATGSLAATLSDSTGTNTVKYCTIGTTYKVNAAGGATWNALTSDGNTVTNGTGWTTSSTRRFLIIN